jgi:ABC-type transporter Mla subunit MlaD
VPQRRQLAALIDNTGQVLGALGERTAAFRSLAVDAKTTAEAANQRDEQFRETLKEIPATLDRAQTSVRKLASFSTTATPVFRSLKLSSRQLSPAIADLGPVAKSTRTLFAELTPFLAKADPLLRELSPASSKLRTVVRPLDAFLRQTSPTAGYLKQYSEEFGSFFANVGALVSAKDALGYRGRVFAMAGPDALTNLTPEAAKIVHALTDSASFGLLKTRMNPYPAPGTAGDPKDFDGSFTQVKPGG